MLLEIVGTVLAAVLSIFDAWVVKKINASVAEKEAIEALSQGVNHTYLEYVREMKNAKEDGKLTDIEAATARHKAWDHAKSVARGPGLKLLLTWGAPRALSLIQDLVAKKSKR